jgi:hypothetical protein
MADVESELNVDDEVVLESVAVKKEYEELAKAAA